MFMQIMQGKVRDADAAMGLMDRWNRDLEPGAIGWLGGTYGVTDDGTMIAAVRFESKEAAQRNSNRPEQDAWWKEMERCFDGPVTFHDCEDVMTLLGGGSDNAGFVQIIQGRVRDRDRVHSLIEQSGPVLSKYRPDIIGATIAIDADGFFTETVAFTSEDEARKGEAKEMPAEMSKLYNDEMSQLEDLKFLDLHKPAFAHR
jgi:hypothetical protein